MLTLSIDTKAISLAWIGAQLGLQLAGATPVAAKTAKCFFSVGEKVYINGKCDFENYNGDGSFSFNDGKMKFRCVAYDLGPGRCSNASKVIISRGTFGQLEITSPGKAKIYWNQGTASHAQSLLSTVTRNGACWESSKAKLCAW